MLLVGGSMPEACLPPTTSTSTHKYQVIVGQQAFGTLLTNN